MLERWTRLVVRNRLAVVICWFVIVFVGFFARMHLDEHLTPSLAVTGSQSAKADAILTKHFDENTEGTFTVLYTFKNSTSTQIEGYKSSILTSAGVIPGSVVVQQRAMGGVLFAHISTPFSLLAAAKYTDALRQALSDNGLKGAQVTGPPAINHDVSPVLAADLQRGQIFAIVLAFLLLIVMLGRSKAVIVPLVFAAASISLTLVLVFLLAQKTVMVLYIPNIVELIGLGLAIDYSLLIVHRYRRELLNNPHINGDSAIALTMATAGRAVLISGICVSIALATLLLVPVPFVHSLGLAGMVVPLASIVAALTLAPALLSLIGRDGDSTLGFKGLMGRKDLMDGVWAKIARFVIHRPKSVFIGSLATLAIMASSLIWLAITPSSLTAIPANLESSQALTMITERLGPGIITPHEMVIDLGGNTVATSSAVDAARIYLAGELLKNPEIAIVATENKPPFIDSSGRYLRLFVIGRHSLGVPESGKLVEYLRNINLAKSGFNKQATLYLGGAPAQGVDLIKAILAALPWIVLLALLLTYLLLARTFRSLILPLKAIALDLISIAVAFASLVLVFRFGFGSSFFGTYRLDQIEAWVLIFMFAVLFGLSMDYEIFLVSRMREARDRGATNTEAIIEGLAHTGGVVSAAAIIFVAAVSGFITGHFAGLQQLGIGLSVGILIDVTIIRGLLLPSSMVLLGRWNWWLPKWAASVLKTKASPLEIREVRL